MEIIASLCPLFRNDIKYFCSTVSGFYSVLFKNHTEETLLLHASLGKKTERRYIYTQRNNEIICLQEIKTAPKINLGICLVNSNYEGGCIQNRINPKPMRSERC